MTSNDWGGCSWVIARISPPLSRLVIPYFPSVGRHYRRARPFSIGSSQHGTPYRVLRPK